MQVYIISYLPDEPKLRQTRLKYHTRQLNWLRNWSNDLYITVCAQNYQPHELQTQLVDRYIEKDKLSPSKARNVLLQEFYQSDEDWCLFLDDDSILYDNENHPDTPQFIEKFFIYDLENVDVFWPIDPSRWPTAQLNAIGQLDDWYKLVGVDHLKTSFWFIRNFKKFYNEELYFDESMSHGEDGEFALRLLTNNKSLYQIYNIKLKEIGKDNSTLANIEFEDRNEANSDVVKYLESKYDYDHSKRKIFKNKYWPYKALKTVTFAKNNQKSTFSDIFS